MAELARFIADLRYVEPAPFWGGWLLALALAGFLLRAAFRSLAHGRLIENTPTALIRSAAQGYTELRGMADLMDGEPIHAPLSRRRCAWYHYRIEHLEQSGQKRNERRWVTVERDTSDNLFQLEDTSGMCAVDPEGATVYPGQVDVWYSHHRAPAGLPPAKGHPWLRWTDGLGKSWRFTEHLIRPGDPLYVIGQFTTHASHTAPLKLDEDVAARLRDWKRDRAMLLARFDADGDGHIDAGEWSAAREAATREVHAARAAGEGAPPPVDLMGPPASRDLPYIISALGDEHVVAASRRAALVEGALGTALSTLALWAAAVRLG